MLSDRLTGVSFDISNGGDGAGRKVSITIGKELQETFVRVIGISLV